MEAGLRRRMSRAVGAIALLLVVGVSMACAFFKSPFIDQKLSGPVTLKEQEWLELSPEEPLKVERDTQEVTLFPDPPIQMVFNGNLVPVNGSDADIEAELIDSNGVTHRSQPGRSATMTGDLKMTTRSLGFKDLPRGVAYKTVRIRSSAAYPVKKILWRCYNWSEARH